MTANIQSVNNTQTTQQAQKPSTTKRIAYTFATFPTAVSVFVKELAKGKNIYEAGNKVKNDYKDVMHSNKENFKSNIKETAEAIEGKEWLCGVLGYTIKGLNSVLNE